MSLRIHKFPTRKLHVRLEEPLVLTLDRYAEFWEQLALTTLSTRHWNSLSAKTPTSRSGSARTPRLRREEICAKGKRLYRSQNSATSLLISATQSTEETRQR